MYTIYGNHAWKGKGREGKGEKKEGYKIERKNNGGGKEGEGQGFDKDYTCPPPVYAPGEEVGEEYQAGKGGEMS